MIKIEVRIGPDGRHSLYVGNRIVCGPGGHESIRVCDWQIEPRDFLERFTRALGEEAGKGAGGSLVEAFWKGFSGKDWR